MKRTAFQLIASKSDSDPQQFVTRFIFSISFFSAYKYKLYSYLLVIIERLSTFTASLASS